MEFVSHAWGPLIGTWQSPKPHNSLNPFPPPPINNTPFHLFLLPLLPLFSSIPFLISLLCPHFLFHPASHIVETHPQPTAPLHNLCKLPFLFYYMLFVLCVCFIVFIRPFVFLRLQCHYSIPPVQFL